MIEAISLVSNDQTQGLNQVHDAVREMDHLTRDNAASAEESASAAEELHAQAAQMRESAHNLKMMVDGTGARANLDQNSGMADWCSRAAITSL